MDRILRSRGRCTNIGVLPRSELGGVLSWCVRLAALNVSIMVDDEEDNGENVASEEMPRKGKGISK